MNDQTQSPAGFSHMLELSGQTSQIIAAIANQLSEGVLITDAPPSKEGHRILFANSAIVNLTGYTIDELVGASPKIFQGEQSDRQTLDRVRASLKAGLPFKGRIVNKKKNGDLVPMDWKINPIHGGDGEIVAWFSVQTDLTRRLADKALTQDLNNKLAQVIETTGDGVLFWDRAADFVVWSDRLKDMLEFSEDEISPVFSSYLNRVVPQDRNRLISEIQRSSSAGREFDIEHEVSMPSGQTRLLRMRGKIATTSENAQGRVVAVVQDISDQRKLERRLLQAEEIANIGSWEVDLINDTVYWSPQVYRIHGYEPGSFKPTLKQGIEAYHPNDRAMVEASVGEAVEKGMPFQFEAVIVQPDGAERNVFSQGFVDFSNDGTPVGIFGVFTDRTEDKAREAHLTKVQRMDALGNFVGGVAHDVNNLLHVILGNLELLEDLIDTEQQKKKVSAALTATLHGSELMHSLLAFARRAPLRAININAISHIDKMLPLLERVLPPGIALSHRYENEQINVLCDPTMLEACIMNLIINARDALPEGGNVQLAVDVVDIDEHANAQLDTNIAPGRFASISINDNGTGMTPEQLRRAHEPFYTTKSGGRGTGLGLARVLGFAEQSGGVFRLYSELDQGTSAKIFLPLNEKSLEEPASFPGIDSNKSQVPGRRILLVEDQQSVSDILVEILSGAGLEVSTAQSGDEAYAEFGEDFDFDLLVTDVVMPGKLQGPDFVQKLRENGKEFPAILISGYPGDGTANQHPLVEADTRLTKPVSKKALLSAVQSALRGLD